MSGKDKKLGRRDFLKIASGGVAAILSSRKFPVVYSGVMKKGDIGLDISIADANDIVIESGIKVMGTSGCRDIAFHPNDPHSVYFTLPEGGSTRIMSSVITDFNKSKPMRANFITPDKKCYDPRVISAPISSISFSPDGYRMALENTERNKIFIIDFSKGYGKTREMGNPQGLINFGRRKEDYSPLWWNNDELIFLRKERRMYAKRELYRIKLDERGRGEAEKMYIAEICDFEQIGDPGLIKYSNNYHGIIYVKNFNHLGEYGRKSAIMKADAANGFREKPLIVDDWNSFSELGSPSFFNEALVEKVAFLKRDGDNPGSVHIGDNYKEVSGYQFREGISKGLVNNLETGRFSYKKIAISPDLRYMAGITTEGELSISRFGLKTGKTRLGSYR